MKRDEKTRKKPARQPQKPAAEVTAEEMAKLMIPNCTMVVLAGGEVLLRMGKPFARAGAAKTARLLGVSQQCLKRLAESGFIRRGWFSPGNSYYYPMEVENFFRGTEEEEEFWNPERRRQYLLAAYPEKLKS